MAGVDLVAEHLSEIPGCRAENILIHRREAVFFQDLGEGLARLRLTHARRRKQRLVGFDVP